MRHARRATIVAVAAALLVGCAADGPQGDGGAFANRAAVANPGALFDVASRSAALQRYDQRARTRVGERVCPAERHLTELEPLVGPSIAAFAGGPTGSNAPRDFGRALNTSAFKVLLDRDEARAARDIAILRRHAEAGAWLTPQPTFSSAATAINGMLPVLPAWQILRQSAAASDADRAVIEGWLMQVARHADVHPGDNSNGTARGANDMLLGLMLGDGARYRKGVSEGFTRQLAGMRADGSFPLEADRGRGALDLTSRNIALMVYSAQIAASAGTDLWALRVDGRGLDDAIQFLLAADADNALVDRYASANRNPPRDTPDFAPGRQTSPWRGGATQGWVKLYSQRFPASPTTAALLERVTPGNRITNDAVGGWVTCYGTRL